MSLNISLQPIRVLSDGQDSQARLILADGQLTGLIVRLDSDTHPPEIRGRWRLEVGFGKCNVLGAPLFKTSEEAGAWVEQLLPGETRHGEKCLYESAPVAEWQPRWRHDMAQQQGTIRSQNHNRE